MMDSFDTYVPGKWLEDGLVVVAPRGKPRSFKLSKLPRPLHLALSTVVLSCALGGFGMPVLAESVGMGNIQAYGLTAVHIDEDIVPTGYWERLKAAVQVVVLLPDQSAESDPPIAF